MIYKEELELSPKTKVHCLHKRKFLSAEKQDSKLPDSTSITEKTSVNCTSLD